MDGGGSWHCTGGRDQDHPQEKEMQKGKMVVWGDVKIEENSRMGKTRDLFKKIRDTKGTFHENIGMEEMVQT